MSTVPRVIVSVFASLAFAAVVLLIARRGRLSMRYTIGWLAVAVVILIGGIASALIDPIADALSADPNIVVFGGIAAILLLITLQLSITASGLIDSTRSLVESQALLEERMRRLSRPGEPTGTVRVIDTSRSSMAERHE